MPEDYLSFIPEIANQVHTRAAAIGVLMVQLEDYERAHLTLDTIGVPRILEPGGPEVSLANRVVYLNGMLVSAKQALANAYPRGKTVVYKIGKREGGSR